MHVGDPFGQRLAEIRQQATNAAPPSEGYYGLPLLKSPVWTWEIPSYFFVGGAAGAAALIGGIARASGSTHGLVRDARWIAAVGGALSPALLIADLGRPERFLNMLRVFKVKSPMSIGAWTVVAFGTAAGAAAFADLVNGQTGGRIPVAILGNAAEALSASTGVLLTTYTGVLIGATAIPVWSRNVGLLPIHFAASGVGAAVSLLELMGHHDRALNRIGIGAAAAESIAGIVVESQDDPVLRPLKSDWSGRVTRVGGVLSGPVPLALRVLAGRSPHARRAAAVCTLVGSLLTRVGWLAAGRVSAAEPAAPALGAGRTIPLESPSRPTSLPSAAPDSDTREPPTS